jgi:hypothetical protein
VRIFLLIWQWICGILVNMAKNVRVFCQYSNDYVSFSTRQ